MKFPAKSLNTESLSKAFELAGCLFITYLSGFVGYIFFSERIDNWYADLSKPSFLLPVGPLIICRMIALVILSVSLFLIVSTKTDESKHRAYMAFTLQLILNCFWSVITFGLMALWASLIVIVLLNVCVGWMLYEFYRIDQRAGKLVGVYSVWTAYVLILIATTAVLNR